MSRKTAIVICPGRGTYNAAELGYLKTHHSDKAELISQIDAVRAAGQTLVTERQSLVRLRIFAAIMHRL